MTDLVTFINRIDLPTFEMAALAHAQFETVHPFPDGNGRVGRALIHAIFKNRGLTQFVTVPVSAGLLTDTDAYFASLDEFRRGNPAAIIECLARASFLAIDNGRTLAKSLNEIGKKWENALSVRSDSSARRIATYVLRQPAISSALIQSQLSLSQRVADRSIDQLVKSGVLTEISGQRRHRRWVANEVVAALDDFAKRAGRRKSG